MSGRLVTAVTLDARWSGATPAEIGHAALALDAAGVDLLILGGPILGLDTMILVAWLAPRLAQAGLVATLPALHTFPFHAARALSALDFLTQGRSGWAPTTLHHKAQGAGVGAHGNVSDHQALAKALDFIDATCALWDSWDADALIIDKDGGVYLDAEQVRRVHYRGRYFQVMGPLNAARPPQGYPVLVQHEADPLWRLTAGRADLIVTDASHTETFAVTRARIAEAGGQARLLATLDLEAGGSAADMADPLQDCLEAGVIDGVHFAPSGPTAVEAIAGTILPQLRENSLVGSTAKAGSLRSRLGLPDHANSGPAHRFAALTAA